jgi:hypothetical protein
MKKLLLILLCLPMIGFGQVNTNMSYLGYGEYSIVKKGATGYSSIKRLKKKATSEIEDMANRQNAKYKIISIQEFPAKFMVLPKINVTFRLLNQDGTLLLNQEETAKNKEAVDSANQKAKDKAIKDLKNLKELLNMNIITKEEYNKKAEELKKVFLE